VAVYRIVVFRIFLTSAMSTYTIRPARIEDAEGVAEVVAEAWKWAYRGVLREEQIAPQTDKSARAERFRQWWNPSVAYVVAVNEEGMVLGFAVEGTSPGAPDFDAEIAGLYVHPSEARRGIGLVLVAAMAKIFSERGLRSLCIHTLRDNRIGRGFYEKIGGVVCAEDYWKDIPAVWYGWDDLHALLVD
jgi:ribosomal protein S18 acetylase RimI-like enzyme